MPVNGKRIILLGTLFPMLSAGVLAQSEEIETLDTTVVQSASEELKQAQGVSFITEEDFKRRPVTNDIAEIVRTMPGINLTGNSSSGQYGNKRQIDIRGMGPENTLILIDGKPVLSRNSVKMGRSGERNTQGDSNWVPAEAIESIEVIRGPAAARYGSGASGGVINIITKSPDEASTSITAQTELSSNKYEGDNRRFNLVTSAPLSERFSHRTIVNYNEQDADDPRVNLDATDVTTGRGGTAKAVGAGREGVENIDVRTLVRFDQDDINRWDFEAAYSRQGNRYAGDNAFQGVSYPVDENGNVIIPEPEDLAETDAQSLIGEETLVMHRRTFGVTHNGEYDFGDSFSYIQYESTSNSRLGEGSAGGGEGRINSLEMTTIKLENITAKTEWNVPLTLGGFNQTATFGAEYRKETLDDSVSNQLSLNVVDDGTIPGVETDPENRPSETDATLVGVYVEDNIMLTDSITLTPGLRFDDHSKAGTNLSPSLNASWQASPNIVVQGGISRAFKAPNLYQLNPNYVYYTRGNGCPIDFSNLGGGCHILGNPDLEHETSVNKEIGVNYTNEEGLNAGITYFHNDYKDKIGTGNVPPEYVLPGEEGGEANVQVFQWFNVPEAVISGLEGNLLFPVTSTIEWSTNFTVMLESEDKSTGQPLSIVPDYTVNSLISWQATDALELVLSAQHYGETESPTASVNSGAVIEADDREAYTITNINAIYAFDENLSFNVSVKNLFNESVKREGTQASNAGANTFNEPERSFLLSATYQF
ncbi:FepA family TonB-dependent siderophore receptor [Alteromonas macleodii]|uniref:FepA family TonB-dependent siderophore receptor n=1 Tax=Alteromonas macleodii TaxID=28108 RepID=UPI002982AA35|nr:FepA family TonB-dependent siderophore receptor [Alteromonas macleodii]MDW5285201.1 FepA family TonB-dependent siderophore receptor [Alteromonas macleodii]